MLSTIPREDALKKELARGLWNVIFNAAVESIVKPDSGGWIVRHTSRKDCRCLTWRTVRLMSGLQAVELP